MEQEANLEDVLDRLRIEYIENSGDKLDLIDQMVSRLSELEGDGWSETFFEFQRQIHTIKGTAGSYGFKVVTEIAHSLEDYLETANNLGVEQLNDVQLYIDQMRCIFEAGENPTEKATAEILQNLPIPNKSNISTQEIRHIPVVLVMPFNIQRKIIANELAACGFRVYFADSSIRAIELAITHKPFIVFSNFDLNDINGVELALILNSIEATKSINIALLSSQDASSSIFSNLPKKVNFIRKGEEFSTDLAECLIDWQVFIKAARNSQLKNERTHLRVSFDGLVTIAKDGAEFVGKTGDISAGGLSVKFNFADKKRGLPFEQGDHVTLNVEELSTVEGRIIRVENDRVIVRFDLDHQLEDRLLAEIMLVTNHLEEGVKVEWGDN